MTDNRPRPPAALLAAVSRDIERVRPAPVPSRQALRAIPVALLAALLIFGIIGVRRDTVLLGPYLAWGVSLIQLAAGIALVWMAARESTPAHRLPKNSVPAALAVAWLAVAFVALWTADPGPMVLPPMLSAWSIGLICGLSATLAGSLLVILAARLFGASLAARPGLVGALFGASAGMIVNSSWRLACPVASVTHTLFSHGAAVIATTLLGAALVSWMAKRK